MSKGNTSNKERFSLYIDDDVHAQALELAKRERRKFSPFIEVLILREAERQGIPLEQGEKEVSA